MPRASTSFTKGIADGGDWGMRTVITSYKMGCVNSLGKLASYIRGWKFDLARAFKNPAPNST